MTLKVKVKLPWNCNGANADMPGFVGKADEYVYAYASARDLNGARKTPNARVWVSANADDCRPYSRAASLVPFSWIRWEEPAPAVEEVE